MARRADQIHELEPILGDLASLYLEADQIEPARERLAEALELARALDDPVAEATYLLRQSELARRAENTLEALRLVRTALDRVRELADPTLISRASMMLGLLLQRKGRDRPARAALAEAVQQARRAGDGDLEAEALSAFGWLLVRARDTEIRDPELAAQAAGQSHRAASTPRPHPWIVLSKVYRLRGDRARGRQAMARAQRIAREGLVAPAAARDPAPA